jgi:hypothetical protein
MTESAPAQTKDKAAKVKVQPIKISHLQRKCACGRHSAGDTAEGDLQRKPMLQRACACGQHTIGGGTCAACSQKQEENTGISAGSNESGFQADFSGVKTSSLQTERFQAKLTVNQPGDSYEQEADRVADTVMSMSLPATATTRSQPAPTQAQRACQSCGEEGEGLQAKEVQGQAPLVTPSVEAGVGSLRGQGQPLSASERAFFEPRFGRDFSQVRVHTGSNAVQLARDLQARAFTFGQNVAFGASQYQPGSSEGRRLMAHELTHTVQQGG